MRARPVAAALVAVVFSVPVKAIDFGMHLEQVAACQAWSSAVIKSPEAVPQEWVAWTYALMSTAVATPLNDDWSPFFAGVLLVGLTLLWPYRDPTAEGRQFLSHHEPFRSQAVVAHQERLTLPMQIGLCVIVIGFLLQLLSVWL